MKTMTLQTEIGQDGMLRLEVPCGLPPGQADVVVIVQPNALPTVAKSISLAGMFAGQLPDEFDVIAEVRTLRRQSTEKALELPK